MNTTNWPAGKVKVKVMDWDTMIYFIDGIP